MGVSAFGREAEKLVMEQWSSRIRKRNNGEGFIAEIERESCVYTLVLCSVAGPDA